MGVLGFAPFIQKHFPEVIKELPQRLRSLTGKTIAIDGTLITQRLHFAPIPCENRHILGWYRLVRELKECGVGVICVFDGQERSHAKQCETARRRKLQRMDVARGAMEVARSHRLRRLMILLKQHRGLRESVNDRNTETLQNTLPTSPVQWGIQEPLQEMALNTDANVSFAKEPWESRCPPTPRIESPARPKLQPDGQTSASRALQPFPDNVQEDPIDTPSHVDETSTIQNLETVLSLRDVLPEYFATADAGQTSKLEVTHKSSLKGELDNGMSSEESRIRTSNVPEVSLPGQTRFSEAVADACDDDRGHLRQPTQSHIAPSPEAAIFNDAVPSTEDAQSVAKTTLTSQGHQLLSNDERRRDDDPLTSPDTVLRPVSYPEESSSPSTIEYKESPESDGGSDSVSQENSDTLLYDMEASLQDTEIFEAEPSLEAISQVLLSLYQEYQESVPTFMSPPTLESLPEVTTISEEDSVREQHMMSRNQAQLTLDEGDLWESLLGPSKPVLENIVGTLAEEKLESLAQKSDLISRSYQKRNNPPTPKTYEECKLILRAMGIPCIEAVGPFEAEALAVSLVHRGLADYVASEDTDVLVYEAPLLRNLTNRKIPLTLLSGSEVREVLQLDRASYVDFALLLGTDFSQRIKNLGPHRAIKLIRTHGRIEHVIANEPKFIPRVPHDAYLKQVEVARLVFETLPPLPDPTTLQPTESDDDAVVAILEKFGVYRAASVDWDFGGALDGNYYGDDPTVA